DTIGKRSMPRGMTDTKTDTVGSVIFTMPAVHWAVFGVLVQIGKSAATLAWHGVRLRQTSCIATAYTTVRHFMRSETTNCAANRVTNGWSVRLTARAH